MITAPVIDEFRSPPPHKDPAAIQVLNYVVQPATPGTPS